MGPVIPGRYTALRYNDGRERVFVSELYVPDHILDVQFDNLAH